MRPVRVSQWSHQSCDRKSAPDFGWVWLRCGGAVQVLVGACRSSPPSISLSLPGLVFLLSLHPSRRPCCLLQSFFFFFLHVAFCAPASFIKGRMLSVLLPLARGPRGPRGRQTRVDRSVATSVDRFSSHQKVTESDGTGGRFSGPGRFVARKHTQRWDAPQCPLPLRITRESSSRPGFHPGRFPALLSQGGSGAFVKASRSWYFGLDLDPTSTRSSCWCSLLSGSTSRSAMSRFEVS